MFLNELDLSTLCRVSYNWYWGFVLVFAFITFSFLFGLYKSLLKSRIIQDTPTSKIRSAHQGYVELIGVQRPATEGLLLSKLSHTKCTWYSYRIEHYHDKKWVMIEHGKSEKPFMLDDGTGICYVDPMGAEISSPLMQIWSGHRRYPKGYPKGFFAKLFGTTGNYRYTELLMTENMPLYALGNFATIQKPQQSNDSATPRLKDSLNAWEKRHTQLLNVFIASKQHQVVFASNQTLRFEAQKELERELKQSQIPTVDVLSGHALDKRHPFILSSHGVNTVLRKYQWDSFIWTVVFILFFVFTSCLVQLRTIC